MSKRTDTQHNILKKNTDLPPFAGARQWKDVDANKLKVFFALTFLNRIIKMPTLKMNWSTNPWLQGSVFSSAMSHDRYFNMLKCIHFANNENYDPKDPNRDRLFKNRSVVELLVERFWSVYLPAENVSIDEELLKF